MSGRRTFPTKPNKLQRCWLDFRVLKEVDGGIYARKSIRICFVDALSIVVFELFIYVDIDAATAAVLQDGSCRKFYVICRDTEQFSVVDVTYKMCGKPK